MARLSNCNLYDRSRAVLGPLHVLRALFFTAVICVLCIGQIYLGFARRDLMIETRKLQDIYAEKLDRRNALTAEVEEKRLATIEQLHQENPLGLEVCPPERRFTGRVTATAMKRWHDAPTVGAPVREQPVRARSALVALGERMLASPSFARAPDGDL